MDTIFDLVRKLVLLSIFAAFMELLLPQGSFRGYARLVVGLLVIAMLLQPILALRGGSLDLDGLLAAAHLNLGGKLDESAWAREQSQDLVEARLAEEAGKFLAQDYPDHQLAVELDLGFDQYGNLTEFRSMEVSLHPRPQGITPVRPVQVGQGGQEGSRVPAPGGIRDALARHLGLPADALSIWIYTGGGEVVGR